MGCRIRTDPLGPLRAMMAAVVLVMLAADLGSPLVVAAQTRKMLQNAVVVTVPGPTVTPIPPGVTMTQDPRATQIVVPGTKFNPPPTASGSGSGSDTSGSMSAPSSSSSSFVIYSSSSYSSSPSSSSSSSSSSPSRAQSWQQQKQARAEAAATRLGERLAQHPAAPRMAAVAIKVAPVALERVSNLPRAPKLIPIAIDVAAPIIAQASPPLPPTPIVD
ncbi:hypothetical protein Vafri_4056, partial [Volvox africanus]